MEELTLIADPAEVRKTAEDISKERLAIERLMHEMLKHVNSLPEGIWQSQSGLMFKEKYQQVVKNVSGSLDRLGAHVRNLSDAAARYEQSESDNRGAVDRLMNEDIF